MCSEKKQSERVGKTHVGEIPSILCALILNARGLGEIDLVTHDPGTRGLAEASPPVLKGSRSLSSS